MTKATPTGELLAILESIELPHEALDNDLFENNSVLLKNPHSRVKIRDITRIATLLDLEPADHFYTDDEKYYIQTYSGSMTITDLRNAMKIGKTCRVLTFIENFSNGVDNIHKALFDLIEDGTSTIEEMFGDVMDSYKINSDVDVRVYETKAKQVFSPFAALKLKRLTKIPAKWTLDHLAKAIANGQYLKLIKKGDNADPLEQLKACVERDVEMSYTNQNDDDTQNVHYAASRRDSRYCVFSLDSKH